MDIKFNEVGFDEFLGAFKKEAVNKNKAKGAKDAKGKSFEKWIAEKTNGKVTRPSSDQNKQGTEIAVSTFLKYVHGTDSSASKETKKWAEREYAKFFKEWKKENEGKTDEKQKGGDKATEGGQAGSTEEQQASQPTKEEVAQQQRGEAVAKSKEKGVDSLTEEEKEDVVAEEPNSSAAQAVQTSPSSKQNPKIPASEPKKTDSVADLSYKLSLSQIGLGDEDSSQLDGRVIDAIKEQNSNIQDGYLFRDKLTLEANTRKDMGAYGLDKIVITVKGVNTNLLKALDNAGVDMDYDRTPFELVTELSKLDLSPEDLAGYSSIILSNGNPALKEVVDKAFDSTNNSDQINFMSMLENHLAISDNEKRKEALKNIKKLDDSAFGDEEDQAWAMIGKEIGEDTLKDMGFTDKSSPAEKRLFMKEYYDQSLTAAKRLRSTTNPKALDVILDVLATEIDGGDSRIMSMASGGNLYKATIDGQIVDANPHYYTEEYFESKKKDLADLKKAIADKKKSLDQDDNEEVKALNQKIEDIKNRNITQLDTSIPHNLIVFYQRFPERLRSETSLSASQKKNLGAYIREVGEQDDALSEAEQELDSVKAILKQKKDEEMAKLDKLKKEVEDTESRTGKLEKAMVNIRKKKVEIENKIKNFNGKGTANRFKIDGQPATFDQAVAAKHLPALALKVQSIQGKMYNGKPLLEAVKAGDKDAIADKKIYLDYHASVLARKEELDTKAKSKGLSDKEKDELKKASSRMDELVKKNEDGNLTDEELDEVDQLGARIDELEGKQRLTKEEEEELDLYNKQGVKAENLTPQQKATKALHSKLKHHQYNPLSITKGVGQGLDDKAKTAEVMGKLVGTYNTMGNGELSMALKDIRSKTDKFKDREDLSKEEQEEKETLEMALDSISIIAQSRGLPLPQGRIPIDPQLMRFLDDDEKLIPPEKKKDALAAIGILARGVEVIDNKTGKPITDINKAAKQRASDQLGEVMKLMSNQAFAEFFDDLDREGKTTLGLRAEMLEDDFCLEKKGGACIRRLTREEKQKIRDDMQNQYMALVELTPDFFAPGVSTKEYLRDSSQYTSKKEKGNLSLDTTPQEFFETEYKKNKSKGGYGDEDEEEGARPSWLNRLDEQMVNEVKSTRDSLKQKGDKSLANATLWQSDAVTNAINDMDAIFDKQTKGKPLSSEDVKKLEESKEYLDKILHKEVGKAKGMSKEDKAMLKKLTEELKELMKEPDSQAKSRKIDEKWTQKKKLLDKNGFDTSKLKKPIPKDKDTQQAGASRSGDLYGGEEDFDVELPFSRRVSSSNSFIPKPLTYYGVNTMKKTAYVDYQGRAQLFKPGMSVYHTINGDPSLSGIVRAVYPAIGMVDVQFPMGDQRLPVEDVMIARDIPLDPLLDKASIPGGVSTQPVSAGAVRVASLYLNRLKGRY
jgi:hypothetical protein